MVQPSDRQLVEFIYESVLAELNDGSLGPATVKVWGERYDDANEVLARLGFVMLGLAAKDLVRSEGGVAGAIRFAETMRRGADGFGGAQ